MERIPQRRIWKLNRMEGSSGNFIQLQYNTFGTSPKHLRRTDGFLYYQYDDLGIWSK